VGEFGRPLLRAEREAGIPELPERPSFKPNPEEDALRAQRMKEQNEMEEAARASVFFQLKKAAGPPGQSLAQDAAREGGENRDGENRLKALDSQSPTHAFAQSDPNKQDQKQSFLAKDTDSRISSTAPQAPPSFGKIREGWVIPAALVTGINSDLPGKITATVTENVYDSATGRLLLIPQGSTLLGEYDSRVAYGQSRVLLVWTRLILPDESSVTLDRWSGVDTEGYAGLEDGVDWHWRRIFAGAALTTLLGAGAELAAPNQSDGRGTVIVATRESIQDSVNQVGQEMTKRNLDIQPTLTNRPGLPLRVIVNKDLILRPYRS
jgi:type IV secretion system protein VirB10